MEMINYHKQNVPFREFKINQFCIMIDKLIKHGFSKSYISSLLGYQFNDLIYKLYKKNKSQSIKIKQFRFKKLRSSIKVLSDKLKQNEKI